MGSQRAGSAATSIAKSGQARRRLKKPRSSFPQTPAESVPSISRTLSQTWKRRSPVQFEPDLRLERPGCLERYPDRQPFPGDRGEIDALDNSGRRRDGKRGNPVVDQPPPGTIETHRLPVNGDSRLQERPSLTPQNYRPPRALVQKGEVSNRPGGGVYLVNGDELIAGAIALALGGQVRVSGLRRAGQRLRMRRRTRPLASLG